MLEPLIAARGLRRDYVLADQEVHALDGVDFMVARGELVAVMGPSGSGKSTLMNILGCLDRPTAGSYRLGGAEVSELSSAALAELRNSQIGFCFQSYNLLPRATAQENVELPLVYAGLGARARASRAREMLALVGLAERMAHRPTELSGGQQQRVAIARALVVEPALILADEPTGNLDSHSGLEIMSLLQRLNRGGITIVLVTHEPTIARFAKRLVRLADGRMIHDSPIGDRLDADHLRQAPAEALAA